MSSHYAEAASVSVPHRGAPPPFRIRRAETPGPVVASLPHSGLYVPQQMRAQLKPAYRDFLPHQDWHLDRLYDFLPRLGISAVHATHSRYVVDPNRALHEPHYGSFWRAAAPAVTPNNDPLYEHEPPVDEVQERISSVYEPYHAGLSGLIETTLQRNGQAWLLDLHSFGLPGDHEICLGDANGMSCGEPFIQAAEEAFTQAGFKVTRNRPFNGGHITRHYAKLTGVQALQIEVSYHLYLDPSHLDKPMLPCPSAPQLSAARPQFEQAMRAIVSHAASG